jgi:hypothetical protein
MAPERELVVEDDAEERRTAGRRDDDAADDEGDWAVVVAVAAGGNEVNKLELREVDVQSEALGAGRASFSMWSHSASVVSSTLEPISSRVLSSMYLPRRPVAQELVCEDEVQERAEGRSLGEAIGDGTGGGLRAEVVEDERGAAETSDESRGLLGYAL